MAFYRCNSGGGGTLSPVSSASQATSTYISFTGLTVGKKYYLLTTCAAGSEANALTYAAVSANSGVSDLTNVNNVSGRTGATANYYSSIREYTFVATNSSVSFSRDTARLIGYMLFEVA